MSWKDNLRPASFRNVPFEVLEDSLAFGRRKIIFEYPQSDSADSEDDNKKPRVFQVNAVIRPGADFMARRDALMATIESVAEPGLLIHPYFGSMTVECTDSTVTHSASEGGWCQFSLEFTLVADRRTAPSQGPDTGYAATSAAQDLSDQAAADAGSGFSIAKQPAFVIAQAHDLIAQAQSTITDAGKTLASYGAPLDAFIARGLALKADIVMLAASPLRLATSISSLVQGLGQIGQTPGDVLGLLSGLMTFGNDLPMINATTPARRQQLSNQQALTQLVQRTAAAQAVLVTTTLNFGSYQEAVSVRDALDDGLLVLAINAGDLEQDEAWTAIEAARQAMVRDVTARGGSLARLYTYSPASDVTALVLARKLYDDIEQLETRADDIVARNAIVDPGAIVGGTVLEVLTDG